MRRLLLLLLVTACGGTPPRDGTFATVTVPPGASFGQVLDTLDAHGLIGNRTWLKDERDCVTALTYDPDDRVTRVVTQDPGALFSRGGLVWYGGFIGGALAVILNGWRLRVPLRWTMHLAAPALAAAYALGRVGCFLVNDDYGRPSSLPWAMKFPRGLPATTAGNMQQLFGIPVPPGTDPGTVLAVHPTQLYETALMLGVFMVLWRRRTGERPIGWLFGLYLVLAGLERFLIEILRAKDDRILGPFTIAQVTSVLLIAIGAALLSSWSKGAGPAPGAYLETGKRAS